MFAGLLALAGSMSWGLADFLGGSRSRVLPLLTVLLVSQWIALAAFVVPVWLFAERPSSINFALWSLAAGVAATVGLAALYRGMAVGLISIVSPLASVGAVIPVVVGIARGDAVTALQGLGMALALVGVLLTAQAPNPEGSRFAAGVGLALVAAVALGLFLSFLGIASETDALWSVFVQRATTVLILTMSLLRLRSRVRPPRNALGTLAIIGLLDASATLLFAAAVAQGALATSSVLASLYPIIPLLLAQIFLSERISVLHWFGIAVVLTGVLLITTGG